MKKFSKSAHQSLSEINITPLLDLAFVLLVIFIITTTPIVNDLDLDLPKASKKEKDPPRSANYVTIEADGRMFLNRYPVTLDTLHAEVVQLRMADTNLSIILRGAAKAKYGQVNHVLALLQAANVVKVDLATDPASGPIPN